MDKLITYIFFIPEYFKTILVAIQKRTKVWILKISSGKKSTTLQEGKSTDTFKSNFSPHRLATHLVLFNLIQFHMKTRKKNVIKSNFKLSRTITI